MNSIDYVKKLRKLIPEDEKITNNNILQVFHDINEQVNINEILRSEMMIISIITLIFSIGIMLAFIMVMYTVIMRTITSQGIRTTFDLIYNFCSGGLIPIPFMPEPVVNILKFTPFYYMQNVSFNIYNGYINNPTEIAQILVIQVVWLVGLTLLGRYLLNKQLSKVIVQGG